MKKLIAILALIVFLFNIVGYQFVANIFEEKTIADLQANLDKHIYNEKDLVSIKVPIQIPYLASSVNFDEVEGNIEISGINYQYVKKRFYNDTLEILCLPNLAKTAIRASKNDFAKQLNDIATSNSNKKSSSNQIVKANISDFTIDHHFDIYQQNMIESLAHTSIHKCFSSFAFLQKLVQPPEA